MFLPSNEKYTYLSSTVVKEMVRYGRPVRLPAPEIIEDVKKKMDDSRREI
jgi:pantetheine-phosphate adenylyltransferase